MVAFFRRLYGLPVIHFFYALQVTLPELACRDGWRAFITGAKLFEWLFEPEKGSPISEVGPFMGFNRLSPKCHQWYSDYSEQACFSGAL